MINLQLNVDYRTNWGESLWVVGSIPALGGASRPNCPTIPATSPTAISCATTATAP